MSPPSPSPSPASLAPPTADCSPPLPTSPKPKTVAFAPPADLVQSPPSAPSSTAPSLTSPASSSINTAAPPTLSTTPSSSSSDRPTPKRRRSSLKSGVQMPYRPSPELYQHADPLLRRLRLRDGYGKEVDLQKEFKEAKVVLFFFGATWPGSLPEPFDLVRQFAAAHPHQCKVVFVSVDSSEEAYELNTKQKPWLSMEWNDGSNTAEDSSEPLKPLEPFLLAGDPDLEEDLSLSTPSDPSLYLRPYSRVYLAEKWNVLGVPNLVVYHPPTNKVLSYHAKFEMLKMGRRDKVWDKWSRGEKVNFSAGDLLYAIRYSLAAAVVATAYLAAVRSGYIPDLVGNATESLTKTWVENR
ncbi:hypothetical protein JCM11251_006110 [Rhodosporidiobolus azoricus]